MRESGGRVRGGCSWAVRCALPSSRGSSLVPLSRGCRWVPNAHFDGGTFDFLTGYTVLTGLTAVALYTLAGAAMVKMRSQESPLVASVRAQGKRLVLLAGGLVVLSAVLLPVAGASSLTLDQPFRVAVLVWTSVAAAAMFVTAWWSFGRRDHTNMAFVAVLIAGVAGAWASSPSSTR